MDGGLDDTIGLGAASTGGAHGERGAVPFDPAERRPLGRTGLSRDPARVRRRADRRASTARSPTTTRSPRSSAPGISASAVRHRAPLRLRRCPSDGSARALGRPAARRVRPVDEGRPADPAPTQMPAGADVDRQALAVARTRYYAGTRRSAGLFDYSADGVRRSIDESLERLGLDRIDIALHPRSRRPLGRGDRRGVAGPRAAARAGRRSGPIGAGMNQSAMLARFAREGDIDVFLLAGRYTLLDQEALAELLPLCVDAGHRGPRRRRHEQRHPRRSAARQPVRLRARAAPTIVERARRLGGGLRPPRRAAEGGRDPVPAGPPGRHHARRRRADGRPPRRVPGACCAQPIPADLWDELGTRASSRPTRRRRRDDRPVIVDAHHHFWDPAPSRLPVADRGPGGDPAAVRAPADLAPLLARDRGRRGRIVVQTRSEPRRDGGASSRRPPLRPFIAGVVGWVDLTDPGVADAIAALRAGPGGERLVGIRHQVHDEPDPDWLRRAGRPARDRGGRGRRAGLRPARPAARAAGRASTPSGRCPDVRFVIDHLAKPPIRDGATEPWADGCPPFGGSPNVWCKVSGLVTEADWATLDGRRPGRARTSTARSRCSAPDGCCSAPTGRSACSPRPTSEVARAAARDSDRRPRQRRAGAPSSAGTRDGLRPPARLTAAGSRARLARSGRLQRIGQLARPASARSSIEERARARRSPGP